MTEVSTLRFHDVASAGEAVIVVRATTGAIAIAASLSDDGDIEVALAPEDCRLLVEALRRAAEIARAGP